MSLHDIKKKLHILHLFEKSTNAMKLMSLSLHHQIKKITPIIYNQNLVLKNFLHNYCDLNHNENKKIFLFVGSERGFCGDYMNPLLEKFQHINKNEANAEYIFLGKYITQKMKKNNVNNGIFIYNFKLQNIDNIVIELLNTLEKNNINYLDIFSIKAKNLSGGELIVNSISINRSEYKIKKNYYLGHFESSNIISSFFKDYIKTSIKLILLDALYAEQCARFIAMDGALNNTKDLIEKNNKLYFKVRQKKINSELDDLVSNLL